jgi:hypothetical protein
MVAFRKAQNVVSYLWFHLSFFCGGVRPRRRVAVATNGGIARSLDDGWKNVFWNCGGMIQDKIKIVRDEPVQVPVSPPQSHMDCPGIQPSSLQ